MNQYITEIGGFDPTVWEDMADETFILFDDILECLPNTDTAMTVLTQKFNDADISNAIIYHLRLLASSWLKGNAEAFEPFIPEGAGVDGYSKDWIERPYQEIDHLGVILLFNALLKPADMVLEIAYLDRSEGDQVNTYRYPDDSSTLGPIIHLLFRPGHYDILYRHPPPPINIQVNRATSLSHRHEITSNIPSLHAFTHGDMSPLSMLPGFGGPSPGLSPLAATAAPSPLGEYTPSPQSPWMSQQFTDPFPQHQQPPPPQLPPAQASVPPDLTTDHPLRFTKYNYPALLETKGRPEPAFTTYSFKNSHFNRAHYNNPEFQPEEYRPDVEEEAAHHPKSGRKRSTKSANSGDDC
jgi:ubiquitin thioesterase protein OTUB1